MAEVAFSTLKSRLNVELGDTSNLTFSSAEKDRFLETAINDAHVLVIGDDRSLTTVANQSEYDIPSDMTRVQEVAIDAYGDGYYDPVSKSAWKQTETKLAFVRAYKGIAAGKTILLRGIKKLAKTDLIPDRAQDYVLELAIIRALKFLSTRLATRFLKNDMTMAELLSAISEHKQEAARLQKSQPQEPVEV